MNASAAASSPASLAPVLRDVRAVVFDTDGVITDSARVHAAAWKTAFDTYLREHPPEEPGLRRPFDTRDDYLRYVDGKSRLDGAAAFLASRGFDPSAGDTVEAVQAVAAEKERLFTKRLRDWGVRLRLERGRLRIAVPPSDGAPIDIRLPGRAVRLPPGQTCQLILPE